MRKIKICEHISLDGVISMGGSNEDNEYAQGDWNGDWTAPFRTVEGATAVAEAFGQSFDLLLGRRTYDLWADFFPTAQSGLFVESINAATKYVATHRPESLGWGPVQGLGAGVIDEVRRLKSQYAADLLVCGSASVTTVLLEHGLVDEMMLAIYPVLLGRGKRLLSDSAAPREFALIDSKATPSGVFLNTYRHVGTRWAT